MSINELKKKNKTLVYLHNGILFCHKKDEVLIHTTMWVKLINIDLSKRSQTQKGTCYDSIYLTYTESVNPQRQNADWWLPVAGVRRNEE